MNIFKPNDLVVSPQFGQGKVEFDKGDTALVRFSHGIEECDKNDLQQAFTPEQALTAGSFQPPVEVLLRLQAETIRSINDSWGVFSPSRIALLPHQLWVCRKVLETWPTKWIIADDVGLGKTIEAGIVLWPLISRSVVKRLLIMCPASLVDQWQYRLRTMFDIRLAQYLPEADKPKTDFWNTHPFVVASLQTLRADNNERHERILDAKSWDLIIVDEAHHLNHDENSGMTLGYSLLKKLLQANKSESVLFFTGTPHRGKNFGFLALMQLLRPDLFDPRKPHKEQYKHLDKVMIRNNKQCVTDLDGKRLFQQPLVHSKTYKYSAEEARFYNMMTEFIASGKAYASKLGSTDGRAVMLVLISMQKLASSSIAAISKALKGRSERIAASKEAYKEALDQTTKKALADYNALNDMEEYDDVNNKAAELVKLQLQLVEDEHSKLLELLNVASEVKTDTKIRTIIESVSQLPSNKSVLFFTEYKATQALLMSELIKRFGEDCVTFINGDNMIEGVENAQGQVKTLHVSRDEVIETFNSGTVRFLVSTEAGGEGVDLQGNCHHLVHVDLPWNPMRLHQRVGRLNRYGQNKKVEVIILRNPDTVESRIWEKLNIKLDAITAALKSVMDDPEDLLQLVLGMTSSSTFDELFFEGENIKRESLGEWFNNKTKTFGGQDALDTVKDLVGNAQKFDFQQASTLIPKVDLPALKPFILRSLSWNKRKVKDVDGYISFKTPESWAKARGVMPSYSGLHFNRQKPGDKDTGAVLGVGHKLVDAAIQQSLNFTSNVTQLSRKTLEYSILVYRIQDKITGQSGQLQRVVVGLQVNSQSISGSIVLRDWELLEKLNSLDIKPSTTMDELPEDMASSHNFNELLENGKNIIEKEIHKLQLPFKMPLIELIGVFLSQP